jgi:hypothetical protein
MRRLVCISLAYLIFALPSWGNEKKGLFEARGFRVGQCFDHLAIRRCTQFGKTCVLEIFAQSSALMKIPVEGEMKLPEGRQTSTDFGRFQFIFHKAKSGRVSAQIKSYKHVSGAEMVSAIERSPVGSAIACR